MYGHIKFEMSRKMSSKKLSVYGWSPKQPSVLRLMIYMSKGISSCKNG